GDPARLAGAARSRRVLDARALARGHRVVSRRAMNAELLGTLLIAGLAAVDTVPLGQWMLSQPLVTAVVLGWLWHDLGLALGPRRRRGRAGARGGAPAARRAPAGGLRDRRGDRRCPGTRRRARPPVRHHAERGARARRDGGHARVAWRHSAHPLAAPPQRGAR